MKKSRAILLLGGTVTAAAKTLGITHSAISQWPEDLTKRMEDRVFGALARQAQDNRRRQARGKAATKTKPPIVAA